MPNPVVRDESYTYESGVFEPIDLEGELNQDSLNQPPKAVTPFSQKHPNLAAAGKWGGIALGVTALLAGGALLYLHFGAGGINHTGISNMAHQMATLWGRNVSVAHLTYGAAGAASVGLLALTGKSLYSKKKEQQNAGEWKPFKEIDREIRESIAEAGRRIKKESRTPTFRITE